MSPPESGTFGGLGGRGRKGVGGGVEVIVRWLFKWKSGAPAKTC